MVFRLLEGGKQLTNPVLFVLSFIFTRRFILDPEPVFEVQCGLLGIGNSVKKWDLLSRHVLPDHLAENRYFNNTLCFS